MKLQYAFPGLVILLAFIILPEAASAQCAMCKAAVEKNSADNGGLAEGLNKGILYMMGIPYIMVGLVGFFWYRASKRNKNKRLYIERVIQKRLRS